MTSRRSTDGESAWCASWTRPSGSPLRSLSTTTRMRGWLTGQIPMLAKTIPKWASGLSMRCAGALPGSTKGPRHPISSGCNGLTDSDDVRGLIDEDDSQGGSGAAIRAEHRGGYRPEAGDHLAVRGGPPDLAGIAQRGSVVVRRELGHEQCQAGGPAIERVPGTRPVDDVRRHVVGFDRWPP